MARSKSHKRSHRRKRGGDGSGRLHTAVVGAESNPSVSTTLNTTGNVPSMDGSGPLSNMKGGRRRRHIHSSKCSHARKHIHSSKCSHRRKHRGGSMLATAALPFGLFGLQKFFQKSRVNPLRRIGRSARRTVKRVF